METIVLGGGCFWCTEAVYMQVRGVVDVESGYSNGKVPNPSYEQVCTGTTDHNEVVKLVFDAQQVIVRELLEIFFVIHDPTTRNRQGNDTGTQYRSGMYTSPVVTEVVALKNYWRAEEYHQDYFEKNPGQGYCLAVVAPKVAKFRKTFARLQK
jgi:peptide-methionine (S)-S-oxide reductase